MSIEAVLFDMDGTLVDSESVHYICWSQLLAPFGVRYDVFASAFLGAPRLTLQRK